MITPENADYLTANLNESFDVVGLNPEVYLVRVSAESRLSLSKIVLNSKIHVVPIVAL